MSSSGDEDNAAQNGKQEQTGEDTSKTPTREMDAPPKSQKDASSVDEEESEEDEEVSEDDENQSVPLLERSPEQSGRRERKKVERYVQAPVAESKRGGQNMDMGAGVPLGDCPVIFHHITTGAPDDVRVLHQMIFARPGRPYEFRKNLRAFRGFSFKKDSPAFEKKKENFERYRLSVLRTVSRILDLDVGLRTGTREELAETILHFLCDPKPSGREVEQKKRKKPKSKGSAGSSGGKSKVLGTPFTVSSEDARSIEEIIESVLRGAGGDGPQLLKFIPKKASKKAGDVPPKKAKKRGRPAGSGGRGAAAAAAGAVSSSEDDEPLQKQAKKPPTDAELRTLVRQLLDGADLEQVTMKNILTRVYGRYPLHDLTQRKDFIKQTVKSLIS